MAALQGDEEEVIDFMSSSGGKRNSFFEVLKRKVQNVATSASTAAKGAASKFTEVVNTVAKCTQDDIDMEQLGITTEDRAEIWKRFDALASESGKEKQFINASTFVADCVRHGQSAKFGDATFRTLDTTDSGEINKYQFLIGVWLTQREKCSKNSKWFDWRRKIIYTYYNKSLEFPGMSFEDFCCYIDELGKSSNPELFGVLTNWDDIVEERVRLLGTQRREREDREREAVLRAMLEAELLASAAKEEHTKDSLIETLISSRVELAQLSIQHENLQLAYRELEKQLCNIKLENATLQDTVEDIQFELVQAQSKHGWNGIIEDTVLALESVGVPASKVLPVSELVAPPGRNEDMISLDMSMAGSTR